MPTKERKTGRALRITDSDYETLATFRRALRRFLAFSEAAARAAGIPPQQHQALLAIKGRAGTSMTVGKLAKDLLIAPHTAAELVERLVQAGLLSKSKDPTEGRRVVLSLTRQADDVLRSLSEAHLEELSTVAPLLIEQLQVIRQRRG